MMSENQPASYYPVTENYRKKSQEPYPRRDIPSYQNYHKVEEC